MTILHHYQNTCITQSPDGAYIAMKLNCPYHPINFAICEKRTQKLIAHLTESPELLHLYHQIITDQEARGFIEKVIPSSPPTSVHYLPHHPVNKDSATTPIHIIYDCSCRKDK